MRKRQYIELKELDVSALLSKEKDLLELLFKIRFEKNSGLIDFKIQYKNVRKDIARVKTLIKEKQTAQTAGASKG
ncbi:MAG: 50S ribosomal protein L29 [Deltaproteobacteria bacterium]|jgi:large subunit ribosomal protein L29|nr:50S ribosomal protein L29 [Deltaproteobacteria bacterium]